MWPRNQWIQGNWHNEKWWDNEVFSSWCQKMKKNERVFFDFRSDGKIEIVRWNDNSVVLIGSNAYSVQPIRRAKWRIKGKGKQNIQQPAAIAPNNRGMGGVGLLDQALSDSRPVICGKKWYWPLVINATNIAFVYSWWLYLIVSGKTISQKDFRRLIVSIMIRQSKKLGKQTILVQQRLRKWLMMG